MFAHFDDLMSLYVYLCVWVFRAWGRREVCVLVIYTSFCVWVIWGRSDAQFSPFWMKFSDIRQSQRGLHMVQKNMFLRGFRFLKALPRPWKRQTTRNLRVFWVSVEFLHCLGCLFRHCLGPGSAKRLVIYVSLGPPFKKYFSERLFLALPRPWKRQKARNLRAFSTCFFWASVKNLFERPFFLALPRPWKRNR